MPELDAAARYARCEALVVSLEGGYVSHPKDPGGPTNMGVTLRALSDWRGHPCTANDVRALGKAEVLAIYRAVYWDAVQGDHLPAGVDLMLFDGAVNAGRGRSVSFLQQALGVEADGDLGLHTLAALAAEPDLCALIERDRLARLAYYKSLHTWPIFGTGWGRRLATVAITATAWARRG